MRLVGRRLPDVLIGVLIVILALGLGSLLLTQRNRAAVSEPNLPAASIPAAPGTEDASTASSATTAEVGAPQTPSVDSPSVQTTDAASTANPPSPSPAASAPRATVTSPTTSAESTASSEVAPSQPAASSSTPAQPEQPSVPADSAAPTASQPTTIQPTTTQPTTAPPSPEPSTGPVTANTLQPPTAPQVDTSQPPIVTTPATQTKTDTQSSAALPSSVPATPNVPVRSGGAVATSENRTPLRRDYRISLGTFGDEAEANSRTAAVKALGYTVYPIDLGDKVVAQIGPFADASAANAALADVERAYTGAVLYAPRGVKAPSSDTSSAASSAPSKTEPASAGPATSQPEGAAAPPAAASSAPAPSGPVYLQVGAFDRAESAQTMVGMLRDLGYAASVQAPEGKKVTVLIGPFSGEAVVRAENKLNDNGFDHFRVR